eukprot:1741248-Prymnesium_polylepis.1
MGVAARAGDRGSALWRALERAKAALGEGGWGWRRTVRWSSRARAVGSVSGAAWGGVGPRRWRLWTVSCFFVLLAAYVISSASSSCGTRVEMRGAL